MAGGFAPRQTIQLEIISAAGAGLDGFQNPRAAGGVRRLDVSGVADGVALSVEGNGAGNAGVGDGGQSGHDGGLVAAVGLLHGLQSYKVSVVAHGGDGGDGVVAAVGSQRLGAGVDVLLNARIKLGSAAFLIEGGDVQLQVGALDGFQNHVVVQRVGAEEGSLNAQRRGLGDDLHGVGDGDRGEDNVRALALGLVQVGAEIGVAGGEGVGDDLAARSLKDLGEEGDQTLVILVAALAQAVGGLGAELAHGEVGQNVGLEVIQEADTEVVAIARGDVGVGAGDADGGNAGLFKLGAAGHGNAGTVGAQNHGHARADQRGSSGGSLVGGGAVVAVDQLDLVGLAAQSDRGLLAVGILHTQDFLLAAGRGVAGRRLKYADLDDLLAGSGAAAGRGTGAQGQSHAQY